MKRLILILAILLISSISLQAESGFFIRGGPVYSDGETHDISGHFAFGTIVKIDDNSEGLVSLGYQHFGKVQNPDLGDEEDFYLSGTVRWCPGGVSNSGVIFETTAKIERSDYTGDNNTANTYLTGYFGCGYLHKIQKLPIKIGGIAGIDVDPGKNKFDVIANIILEYSFGK